MAASLNALGLLPAVFVGTSALSSHSQRKRASPRATAPLSDSSFTSASLESARRILAITGMLGPSPQSFLYRSKAVLSYICLFFVLNRLLGRYTALEAPLAGKPPSVSICLRTFLSISSRAPPNHPLGIVSSGPSSMEMLLSRIWKYVHATTFFRGSAPLLTVSLSL